MYRVRRSTMLGIFKNNSCSGHHYGEWKKTNSYRSRDDIAHKVDSAITGDENVIHRDDEDLEDDYATRIEVTDTFKILILEQKEEKRCKHNNCSEKEERWVEKGAIRFDDYVEFIEGKSL